MYLSAAKSVLVTVGLETEVVVRIVHMTSFSVSPEEEVWTNITWHVFNASRGALYVRLVHPFQF